MKKNKKEDDMFFPACSAGDCTGLIPSGVENDEQLESYNEIYEFIPNPVSSDNSKIKNYEMTNKKRS